MTLSILFWESKGAVIRGDGGLTFDPLSNKCYRNPFMEASPHFEPYRAPGFLSRRLRGLGYWARCKLDHRPTLVNLEFTKLCNAKCFFCSCWQVESPNELQDYGPVVARFKPVVCSVSGGEPLLRKNYAELLRGIRPHCHYFMIITNGARLNEEVAEKLKWAGIDQITISLDYFSDRHDQVRKIDGLFQHIAKLAPRLTAQGYHLCLNTIIMDSNMEDVVKIAHAAKEWGVHVSYSSFCTLKANEESEMVSAERIEKLKDLVNELKKLKRKNKNIKNSEFYLDKIPEYFSQGEIKNCKAGHTFIAVTPDGYIQRCSELPRMAHYSNFWAKDIGETLCTKCWYSCRGETEAPILRPKRIMELLRS